MRIVQVVPGFGGTFYCENCLRDAGLVRAMLARGHDVVVVPMYLPLQGRTREALGGSPMFFGGVKTWLSEHSALFRRLPEKVRALSDAPWLLRMAARRADSTDPRGLGKMTLSMLRGEQGPHSGELDRLVSWLSGEVGPDVVHLSNALLLGLARSVRERTGAAVVCSLQDEAPWIDAMAPPWDRRVWDAVSRRSAEVDAFVSGSGYYAGVIARRMAIDPARIAVVPNGVDVDGYLPAPMDFDPPAIGYLARMNEACGLGVLVEAFLRLKALPRHADLHLLVAGGKTSRDDRFLARLRRRLAAKGVLGSVRFFAEFEGEAKAGFLSSLCVLSVPGLDQKAFGHHILEAMAAGVPVVEPRAGGFTELVEAAGGGILYEPEDPDGLFGALDSFLSDRAKARELGRRAREGAAREFSMGLTVTRLLDVYRGAVERRKKG